MSSLINRIQAYCQVKFENITRPKDEFGLIIIDDLFPYLITIYRLVEFNAYLKHLPGTVVYSTTDSFRYMNVNEPFSKVLHTYEQAYPEHKGKVLRFDSRRKLRGKLCYVVFLHIAHQWVEFIEMHNIPFVMTLYPGGTFEFNDEVSDAKLRRVCESPMMKKIITNQKILRDYLVDNNFCTADKVEFIYGTLIDSDKLAATPFKRAVYKQTKSTFDICFVGFKYMPRGTDKGYDTFIDTARILCAQLPDVRFHVVGGFSETDIDITDIKDRFTFYGPQKTDFFLKFHAGMDAILSPNVPFMLRKGAFDGFPLGTCVDAALLGVAVFCTDYLNQNLAFEPGREIEIIDNNAEQIAETIAGYYHNYDRLLALGRNGQAKFEEVYSFENQMVPRLALFRKLLAETTDN